MRTMSAQAPSAITIVVTDAEATQRLGGGGGGGRGGGGGGVVFINS
jgi:hypothetical protein